jgi:hypothetical protein
MCLVFKIRDQKLIIAIVEGPRVNFFLCPGECSGFLSGWAIFYGPNDIAVWATLLIY